MNKSHILNQLLEAKDELNALIEKLSVLEKTEPEGELSIRTIRNATSFYCRADSKDKTGTYLNKENRDLIKSLAQKRYNHKLRDVAQADAERILKCIEIMKDTSKSPDSVIESMPEQIRPFINQNVLADENDIRTWIGYGRGEENPRKSEKEITTANGEKVKSKSEVIIADRLKLYGVPYSYEMKFDDTWKYSDYPDFTCLNKRTGKTYYWEHCGRFDDPKYSENLMIRIIRYASHEIYLGSELIITMETSRYPLHTPYVDKMIERYLL